MRTRKQKLRRSARARAAKKPTGAARAAAVVLSEARGDYGHFDDRVHAKWLADGRNMSLLAPLVFRQRGGAVWTAPQGTLTDGASIPEAFWSVIGGPFEGKYRDAAVNHDYECCVKVHPWRAVHRMFYDGMRANGEDPWVAKLMYFAVYFFGPRWPAAESVRRERFTEGDIARVARWLKDDPTIRLEDIEALTSRSLRRRVPAKPRAIEGSNCLSDDRVLVPVDRLAPCVEGDA